MLVPGLVRRRYSRARSMPKTILLIQDDPEDASAVHAALLGSTGESFRIERVRGCAKGIERLNEQVERKDGIDVVLVDLFLPDSSGITTFDQIHRVVPHTPILVLSELHDEDIAKSAVQQ